MITIHIVITVEIEMIVTLTISDTVMSIICIMLTVTNVY